MWIMMQQMWPHPKWWFSLMKTPTKHAPTLCQASESWDWGAMDEMSGLQIRLFFQKQSRQNQSKNWLLNLMCLAFFFVAWLQNELLQWPKVSSQILQMFSLVACFVFCFLPSCWVESSWISHVFTQPVDLGLQEVAAIWKTPREDKKTK